MTRIKFTILMAAGAGLLPCPANGAVVYNLMNYTTDQSGHTLDGSLTTVDTAADDGLLAVSEILNWRVEIGGPNGFSHDSADGGLAWIDGSVGITPTEITLNHVEDEINTLELRTSSHSEVLRYLRISDIMGAGVFDHYSANPAWENNAPALSGVNHTWVLASADPLMDANVASWAAQEPGVLSISSFSQVSARLQPVPEPSGLVLLASGLFLAVRRRAPRRAASRFTRWS